MGKRITDLSAATTPLAGTELVEIVQGGVSKKVEASHLATSGIVVRDILSAARTYYVRTDGSDSNDGLSNTSGGAFLTIQKAVNTVYGLDIATYNVTIQVADGTYSGAIVCNSQFLGSGVVTIQGNSGTPANVVLSTGSSTTLTAQNSASISIKDLKVTNTSGNGIRATSNATISFQNIDFGSVGASHMLGDDTGGVICTGNYSISGGGTCHMRSASGFVRVSSRTVTLSGTPAFSTAFAQSVVAGTITAGSNTYSGSATGVRYDVSLNSVINTNSGGANYFPGNSAGTTATGGQYA